MTSAPARSVGEVVSEFRQAMAAAGLNTSGGIRADGTLNRLYVEGDRRGSKNGWAILHVDEHPAGVFGSWRTGLKGTWSLRGEEIDPARAAEWARRVEQIRAAREAQRKEDADRAAARATREWDAAAAADHLHPYLVRKQVPPIGLRVAPGGELLVPMRSISREIRGLQRIYANGDKRFTKGMGKAGTYFSVGSRGPVLVVCEGVATGLSIHVASSLPVACAMDAGNLVSVARALREKLPESRFVIAADSDATGLEAAEQAAFAAGGGLVLAPDLTPEQGTDWNDAAAAFGLDYVHETFAAYCHP